VSRAPTAQDYNAPQSSDAFRGTVAPCDNPADDQSSRRAALAGPTSTAIHRPPGSRQGPSQAVGGRPDMSQYAPNRTGFGLPNLRRNVCPHFYMTGSRGAIPIQAPHLLKALIRQDANVSRCQLRGGVHMEQGYVNDVCLTPRFNQCVFYEDDLTRE